ncbi:DUF2946 family protein [Parvibaculum sp.]|uniref:DUF2946 family protein n=1 Tax=Parvibaculum sp. TaxID=2024848 RepID=UPI0035208FFA
MRIPLTQRRLLTWLTLWAMGLGALAPTLAQAALRAGDPVPWVQVCSSTGMFWVRAGEPAEAPLVEGEMACPWCVLGGGADAPAAAHALPQLDAPAISRPLALLTALHAAASWAQPPARAPPSLA